MMDKSMVQKILDWKGYYIKDIAYFWIYHKKENMGRPFDAQYILSDLVIKSDLVEITYDQNRKLIVENPKCIDLLRDEAGSIHLVFRDFDSIETTLADSESENPQSGYYIRSKKILEDDEIRLVGHSPDISDPKSCRDQEYNNLFDTAQVILKW
jgi:hypothetical protein